MTELRETLEKTCKKGRKYTLTEIACIEKKSIQNVKNWIYLGLRKNRIRLHSILDGGYRVVLGEWIIEFFVEINESN